MRGMACMPYYDWMLCSRQAMGIYDQIISFLQALIDALAFMHVS
jgi:hypothetical protein